MTDYKFIVVGSSGVGKTSLVLQFIQGHFRDIFLDILDSASASSELKDEYMIHCDGIVCIFAVTRRSSFGKLNSLRDEVLRAKDALTIPTVLIGTQCDIVEELEVTEEEGKCMAQKFQNCPFFLSSAKQRKNVEEPFYQLVREIREARHLGKQDTTENAKNKSCVLC